VWYRHVQWADALQPENARSRNEKPDSGKRNFMNQAVNISGSFKHPTVLHVFPIWLPQTQTWMYNQVAELQHLGVDAHVVCEQTANLDQFNVDNIHCMTNEPWLRQVWDKGMRKLRLRRHLDYLVREGRKAGAQIVHSHFGNVGWANLGAVRWLKAKHVVTFYGLDVNMLPQQPCWRKRYLTLFSEADMFLCEGPHMAKCLVELGCPSQKVCVHHLGVRLNDIPFVPRPWHPGETLNILMAATFREKKGIPDALEALGRFQKEVPIKITLIGDSTSEERSIKEGKRIDQVIARHGLQARIRMLGFQPYDVLMKEAYEHHIFLSPSVTASDGDTEGGAPVTIIEMAAAGMPIISTKHCDIPNVIIDRVTGLLADEHDVEGILECLRWLIQHPEKWKIMLEAGRRHIEEKFDVSKQGSNLLKIYNRLST
jgi:colanic acid/amylovoran biosynthesis glycosyltransferase